MLSSVVLACQVDHFVTVPVLVHMSQGVYMYIFISKANFAAPSYVHAHRRLKTYKSNQWLRKFLVDYKASGGASSSEPGTTASRKKRTADGIPVPRPLAPQPAGPALHPVSQSPANFNAQQQHGHLMGHRMLVGDQARHCPYCWTPLQVNIDPRGVVHGLEMQTYAYCCNCYVYVVVVMVVMASGHVVVVMVVTASGHLRFVRSYFQLAFQDRT